MTEKILKMVDAYWKFDSNQQPMSSWHDKQDLLKALEELLQPAVSGQSEQLPNSCECDNVETFNGWGNEKCFRCVDCGRVW